MHREEQGTQGVVRVGVIDQDGERLSPVDPLEAAGNAAHPPQPGGDGLARHAERQRRSRRGPHVEGVRPAEKGTAHVERLRRPARGFRTAGDRQADFGARQGGADILETHVGVYHRHAKLDGQWRDCVIVEKLLADR